MLANWKTTLAALLLNAAYVVLSAMTAGGITPRDIALMVGLQAVGTLAKDFNVTGVTGARRVGDLLPPKSN